MHELAVCQALLSEVEDVRRDRGDVRVVRVSVRVGPLSGVEPELLSRAFEIARAGGPASDAELLLKPAPVRVRCLACSAESEVPPNRLVCGQCGGWRTQLISGDELLLERVEFEPVSEPLAEALHV